jgi:hypothetical protein
MVSHVPANVEQFAGLVADPERDGKGVPILLRQYLKTGGKLLGCNVDRGFSDVLEALVMVDLRSAPALFWSALWANLLPPYRG